MFELLLPLKHSIQRDQKEACALTEKNMTDNCTQQLKLRKRLWGED